MLFWIIIWNIALLIDFNGSAMWKSIKRCIVNLSGQKLCILNTDQKIITEGFSIVI